MQFSVEINDAANIIRIPVCIINIYHFARDKTKMKTNEFVTENSIVAEGHYNQSYYSSASGSITFMLKCWKMLRGSNYLLFVGGGIFNC